MNRPTLEELRRHHPSLTYESWSAEETGRSLRLSFVLRLEPDIIFTPTLTVPIDDVPAIGSIEAHAFNLGMIETLSYWKAACPPTLRVTAGPMSEEQVAWWHDLYLHGLGEFFLENDIDFKAPDFLSIVPGTAGVLPVRPVPEARGELLLIGGGKDSAVTADILKPAARRRSMALNPIPAAIRVSEIAGYGTPLIVERTIDPTLLRLNAEGYRNGHTPFSAVLAFVGSFVAALGAYRHVIVSNERGASEPQAVFHGQPINHQYSKSFRFEQRFQWYAAHHLSPDVAYFSFVRPLFDLQIAELFAGTPAFHAAFRSCNVGQKTDSWCGRCAKCAFVYLSLGPFLDVAAIESIFGHDILASPAIVGHLRNFLGLGDHIPFDCVGTEVELRLALVLTIQRRRGRAEPVHALLTDLQDELAARGLLPAAALWQAMRDSWSDEHAMPAMFADLLRSTVATAHG